MGIKNIDGLLFRPSFFIFMFVFFYFCVCRETRHTGCAAGAEVCNDGIGPTQAVRSHHHSGGRQGSHAQVKSSLHSARPPPSPPLAKIGGHLGMDWEDALV